MSGIIDVDRMRNNLSQLAVQALSAVPRDVLRARRYALGYHLACARIGRGTSGCVKRAIQALKEYKREHPEAVDTRVEQMRLPLEQCIQEDTPCQGRRERLLAIMGQQQ